MEVHIRLVHLIAALGSLAALAIGVRALVREPPPTPAAPAPLPEEDRATVARASLAALMLLRQATCGSACSGASPFGLEVAQEARWQLTHPDPDFRDDCSGFVSAVFSAVGVPMDGVVISLWDRAVAHEALHWDRPQPGDVVFFERTYDRDLDERTHVGIVLAVEPDGTATFAHAGITSGRGTGRLNADRASVQVEDGRVLNSYLREPDPWDPPDQRYLAGELWTAFARIDPEVDWISSE